MARVPWLDTLRGLAIALMVLCDDAGTAWRCMLEHAPWHGLTPADLVFPLFLHASGLSLSLSRPRHGALPGVVFRAARLCALGVLLQGPRDRLELDLSTLRLPGILQRVALAGLPLHLLAVSELPVRRWRVYLLAALILSSAYLYLTHTYHTCRSTAHIYSPHCNAAFAIDDRLLGRAHMYHYPTYRRTHSCSRTSPCYSPRLLTPPYCTRHFDPEGLLGTLNAAAAVLLAAAFQAHAGFFRPMRQLIIATLLGCLGAVLAFFDVAPINKSLYTTSYLLVTVSICMFAVCILREVMRIPMCRFLLQPVSAMGAYPLWMFAIGGVGLTEFVLGQLRFARQSSVPGVVKDLFVSAAAFAIGDTRLTKFGLQHLSKSPPWSLLDAVKDICLAVAWFNKDAAEVVYVGIKLLLMSLLALHWSGDLSRILYSLPGFYFSLFGLRKMGGKKLGRREKTN